MGTDVDVIQTAMGQANLNTTGISVHVAKTRMEERLQNNTL